MALLYINHRRIRLEELKGATQEEDMPYFEELDDYARATLSFCRQWLRGASQFVMHTSGSTGEPKPIALHRHQMETSARMTLRTLQLTKEDTALVCLNTAYIAGKMMLVRGMEAGMDLLLVSPDSLPFAQVSTAVPIRFAAMVPLQVQATLATGDMEQLRCFNRLKALLIGGAPVSYRLQQEISRKVTAPVFETYGMTETVSHIALKRLNGPQQSDVYTVLDGFHVETDERGCLTVQGAVTQDQKIVTNDVVRMIDSHHFQWIGRADHIINSGGYKIFPEKVERVIARMLPEDIARAFFIGGLPDERLGEKAVLIIEGKAHPPAFEKDLWVALRQQLHAYELPKAIYYVPEFIRTATNKINRRQTLALLA